MPVPGFSFTDQQLFNLVHITLPAWGLLIVAPRAKLTQAVVNLSTAAMCMLYMLLIYNVITNPSSEFSLSEMASWDGVAKLFKMPQTVLPAWVHYVAFDLWTARWIALDGASRGIPRLLLAPILLATLMLGPSGLALYMVLRGNWKVKSKSD